MALAEPFWWAGRGPASAAMRAALVPVAWVYGTVAARRMAQPAAYVSALPVVCVGNVTAGGAGKTPTALALAALARAAGLRPVFLTRGHGGTLGTRAGGPVFAAPSHTAGEIGDEAPLLAAVAPTCIARDRAAGARAIEAAEAGNLIIMDDGLQNPSLAKTLRLVVVDGGAPTPLGVIPAGPLRAPLAGQLALADAILVIDGAAPAWAATEPNGQRHLPALPCLAARLVADGSAFTGQRVVAFAGIGRPEKFFASLRAAGAEVVSARPFADHHRFTAREAAALLAQANSQREQLVTTAKDFARLAGRPELSPLADACAVLNVRLEFAPETVGWLAKRLALPPGPAAG